MKDKSKKVISNFFKSVCRANCCECALSHEECFLFCKEEGKKPCDLIGDALACLIERLNEESK